MLEEEGPEVKQWKRSFDHVEGMASGAHLWSGSTPVICGKP